MRAATLIVVLWVGGVAVLAQDAVDSVEAQARARVLTARADSLRKAWDVQWKRSDSLRIESMFLRMRADSLRREASKLLAAPSPPAPDPAVDAEIVNALAARARSTTVRSGQTMSDSLTRTVMRVEPDTGVASYYAEQFHGKRTSSGEAYDMHDLTCAHRWLPYNTKVRVTNLANNRSVIVRVNDRGPFKHTRLIDLSKGAAKELDMIRAGTARVVIEVVDEE
jgi:rare lipoprotein A